MVPLYFFYQWAFEFLDFFLYLLPFYFIIEALLIRYQKTSTPIGQLFLLSLCPLSLLSPFIQIITQRVPLLTEHFTSQEGENNLMILGGVLFILILVEVYLFIKYAYILFFSSKEVKTPESSPLTDGIPYIKKGRNWVPSIKTIKEKWDTFLVPEQLNQPMEENEFESEENPTKSFSPLKALRNHFYPPKPELRPMETISYPYPEERPYFPQTKKSPNSPPFEKNVAEGSLDVQEESYDDFQWPYEEETNISLPDENPMDYYEEQDEEEQEIYPFNPQPLNAAEETLVNAPTTPSSRRKSASYKPPSKELLTHHQETKYWIIDEDTKEEAEILRSTLEEFGIQAQVTGITRGPVVTMFELLPAPGVKLSRIANLADNIALRLAAGRVRIVAPIPGKHAVGIEVPNRKRALVSFKELIEDNAFKKSTAAIPVILGKDITGNTQVIDLASTPHLLIAGSTGSGKSVCVNSIITSILYKKSPSEVRMILIDPKIVELKMYNDIPHLLTPVITDAKRAYMALQYGLSEMERRYNLLDALGARNITSYNQKAKDSGTTAPVLPYIVIVIDEFADLMTTNRKELEQSIARLAAMSRAVGIHLILATQRPSVDVITGLIKANIPSRIAFMTASKIDSRTILDSVGAEKLLGKGDMLFVSSSNPYPSRIQGTYLSEQEVETVTDYVKSLGEPDYLDDEIFMDETELLEDTGDDDPLFDEAVEIVVQTGKASASYLQRRLQVGYNRAARMIETMEARGYIGPQNGSKPREVLVSHDR